MRVDHNRTSLLHTARIAGILYLTIIVCGIFSEVAVRARLIVPGDAALTAANIRASSVLFRAGFVADTIMLLSDVAIAVLLYALLESASRTLALMAAVFRLAQAVILGASLLYYHGALLLLGNSGYGGIFADNQPQALAFLLLDLHGHGYDLGLLFFAISTFILGHLLRKSELFPAVLGYGLQGAAVVYLVGSYIRFLLPELLPLFQPFYVIPLVVELSFCLWLLIKGVKREALESS